MFKLLPCPFCGGEAEFRFFLNPKYKCYVCCTNCDSSTSTNYVLPLSEEIKENKKTHAAAWNRRINTPSAVQKLKNERCAGRKKKISESSIIYEKILDYHRQKISMREIARYFNVSVGTVHKIINEHKQMLEGANA